MQLAPVKGTHPPTPTEQRDTTHPPFICASCSEPAPGCWPRHKGWTVMMVFLGGGSQVWGELGLVGHSCHPDLSRLERACHMTMRSYSNLGPHAVLWGLREVVRKMFAFLCVVSSDTTVLHMRPRVSCLQGASQSSLTTCWPSALSAALCWRPHGMEGGGETDSM